MQTGHILLFLIVPTFMERGHSGNHTKNIRGLQQNIAHQHYRVVKGEIFMIPCTHKEVVCSRIGEEGNKDLSFDCGEFPTEAKHSGNYTCLTGSSKFHLQVVEKTSLRCSKPDESSLMLIVSEGGMIPCPGLDCYNRDVIWYKGIKAVSNQIRGFLEKNGYLRLDTVSEYDTGVYFCDRQINEQGVMWTFRRAINITTIPYETATDPPKIVHHDDNMIEEVELGQPHTLTCKVYFPFEINFSPEVKWYMNYGGNMENMTLLHMQSRQQKPMFKRFEVIQRAIINVTSLHLNHTYTCIARNTVDTRSITVKLKKKIKVKWSSLVGYPIVPLLLVAGLGIVLHVKRLEVQLIYRYHFQRGKRDGDEKEFDVFLSYVWSPSAEEEGGLTLSSPSRPDTDVKACLSSLDLLNTEENTQRALEVLLPQVLEDWWGYRLCLLERDVLPGGAYTDDVVHAIQRSKMLICLLSDNYLSNSNAVFVLESGVQALLKNSAFKLLLIWTGKTSTSITQPNPPLPSVVQRALKVLPSLDWTSGKPARGTSNFWRSLRKDMPNH